MTVSSHQRAALVALQNGPKSRAALVEDLGIAVASVTEMMKALRDRGFIRPIGKRGSVRQAPTNYTYELTTAGRAAIESTKS